MLAVERHRRILESIKLNGSLRTVEIAATFGVTDETIRKDFEFLEQRGELLRIHGGATRPARAREELPLTERQLIRREEKHAIARLAAARIQANETIFLDASSTALTVTEFLPDVPLTIVTNALNVFTALEGRPNYDLICTGGLYDARSRSYIGLLAETSLKRFNVHRMFLSGNGVDIERGISESNSRQAVFKERVIAISEEVVVLADHSKIGQKSSFFFGEVGELHCLITDAAADPAILHAFREKGLEVVVG